MPHRIGSVQLTDVVRYAGASGDLNPIHYDAAFAKAAGYDGVFAMGALHGGWLVSHVAPLSEVAPSYLKLRYHGVVPLGLDLDAESSVEGDRVTATLTGGGERKVSLEAGRLDPPPRPGAGGDEQRCAFPVELGTAKRFAEAVRWPAPLAPGAAVPPTYLSVLSFWLPNPDPIDRVGFDRSRTLLGETAIELTRGPLRVGETLDVREYVGPTRTRAGRAGEMRLTDLVAELSDQDGLRVVYRNTFILMPEPTTASGPLKGSRDTTTGDVYFPPRALSVDGRLRPLADAELATEGILYSWTTYEGNAYGQVDLAGGVRLQAPLSPGEHEIGAAYRMAGAPDGEWWFERA